MLCVWSSSGCASVADVEPDPADATPALLTYYRDVKPIIDAHCTPCHKSGGIGGRGPLTSYRELAPVRELVAKSVASGRMPPWPATQAPFELYRNERRLTPEQRRIVVDWVQQGGVPGDPADETEPEREPFKRGITRVDGKLEMAEPYTPLGRPDEYRCFSFDWPYDTTKYITAVGVEPGVRSIVQRAIAYVVPKEHAQRVRDRDEAAPGPGYPCTGVSETGAWIGSYARGGYGIDLPDNVGFEVQPGAVVVLLVHYNTAELRTAVRSRIEYTVEDSVERVGAMVLIENPLWVAGYMPIPAGEPDVLHSVVTRPTKMIADHAYDLYTASLHMRRLGRAGSVGIVRNGSRVQSETTRGVSTSEAGTSAPQSETVLSIPKWSFQWQETYVLSQSVRVAAGDGLYVECHFDNTQENQPEIAGQVRTAHDVNWGDKATDELCMGAVLLVPTP